MGVLYALKGLCWCVEFQNLFESAVRTDGMDIRRINFGSPTPRRCTKFYKPQATSTRNPQSEKRPLPYSQTEGWCGRMVWRLSPISSRVRLTHLTGDTHRRQRKSMMPAFGLTTSREYLPRLIEVLDKVRSSSGHPFRDDVSGVARWNVERSRLKRIRGGAGDNRRT